MRNYRSFALVYMLIILLLFIIATCYLYDVFRIRHNNTEHQPTSSRHIRLSWHGTSAYPKVPDRNGIWSWLLTFLESANEHDSSITYSNSVELITSISGDCCYAVTFPNGTTSLLQKEITITKKVITAEFPRFDCYDRTRCNVKNESHPVRFRPANIVIPSAPVVFINFLYCDTYDVERLIVASTASASLLVMHFKTEIDSNFALDENYILKLYDMFHATYFQYDWIPVYANFTHCKTKRHDCSILLIWKKWKNSDILTYIPPAGNGSKFLEAERLRNFFNNPNDQACLLQQQIGGEYVSYFRDGGYQICLEDFPVDSCLVYSFGINFDFSFDDGMHSLGCTVYSFDPSMGHQQHKRNTRHYFYPWGLGKRILNNSWTMMTLHEIRTKLNHLSTNVTILKMDIEESEYDVLAESNLYRDFYGIKQIMFESHPPASQVKLSSRVMHLRRNALLLHRLEKLNYYVFSTRKHPWNPDARLETTQDNIIGYQYELSYRKFPKYKQHLLPTLF